MHIMNIGNAPYEGHDMNISIVTGEKCDISYFVENTFLSHQMFSPIGRYCMSIIN